MTRNTSFWIRGDGDDGYEFSSPGDHTAIEYVPASELVALAAHIEWLYNSIKTAKTLEDVHEVFELKPETSLARRDAEVKGKAFREVAAHIYNGEMPPSELAKWCLTQDIEGRYQAEGEA